MGSWVTMVILLLFLSTVKWCSAKYFIAAPNMLRVGVKETVSITLYNAPGPVTVKIFLQDYPHRKKTFSKVEDVFLKDTPGILKVKVDPKDLSDQKSLDKQYVFLVATSNTAGFNFRNEMKILVSYRNAMVFIQTDKPIYTPGQTVHLRVVPLDLNLKASLGNVTIDIMNPQGIRENRWKNLNTDEGFFSRRKDLAENALLGNWTVSALYGHGLVQNASVQFEVREYVLPRFSVKIKGPPYILETDKDIEIGVTSEYTYGKSVKGSAQLILAVVDSSGKSERFSTSFLDLVDGKAKDFVRTDLLKKHAKKLWFPEGKRLFIEAKVVEKATGKQEEAMDNTIFFTKSPYKISFKRTPKFFKPGVPYEIKIDVSYLSGKPAQGIDIEIEAKTDSGVVVHERRQAGRKANLDTTDELGHGSFVVDVPKTYSIKFLIIKVRTKTKVPSEHEFRPTMYSSSKNNYLFVRIPKSKVGETVDAEAFVLSSGNPGSLTYMVVARGMVVAQGTIVKNLGVVTTIRFRVTPAMSPQARFIVYYTVGNEIVADSAIMEVHEGFPNQVTFEGKDNRPKLPGESHILKIKADPHSWVGILAVDQSVYLLRNDKQLTSDTVFKRMKSHDLGCGAGAGQNNKDVLERGGLAVMTNYGNLKTSSRNDYSCSAASRRRRSADISALKDCCSLGKKRDSRDCLVIAKEFSKKASQLSVPADDCVIAFYKCCLIANSDSRSRSHDNAIPPDMLNELGLDMDEDLLKQTLDDAQIRTNFPETWLYEDKRAGKNGLVEFRVTVPDTITTWVMQAMGVSNKTGFGLTPPHYLTAFKHFFVTLSMPYSAQRGEQVSIVATVFNYQENQFGGALKVRLTLRGSKEFCSSIEPGKHFTVYDVHIKSKDAVSVSFPIVPISLGEIPIEVKAASVFSGDGYRKMLKVVPEGMQRTKTYSVVLDPQGVLDDPKAPKPAKPVAPSAVKTGSKGNGVQKNSILVKVPDSSVPDSESAQLFLMGNLIGPVVDNLINGRGLNSLIRLPTGCGEQTMLSLGPNVFVFQYLRSTKQVTPQIEKTAFGHIRSGYQRELTFRRSDHSFSAWGNRIPGSTWLTAFVIKTFCAAQKLDGADIDPEVICSGLRWLSSIQQADGVFPERQPVYHQEMNGDINGDIAMTAYVLTTFLECNCATQNTVKTISKAVTYLEKSRPPRVYVKAVVAYALAIANSPQRFRANNELLVKAHYDSGKNTRYWTDGGNAINVETTAYALLTQVVLGRISYSGPIVVWLTEQRKGGGGFVSTQDTCVALQALAAYSESTDGAKLDLTVEITSAMDSDYKRSLRVDKGNALIQQQLDISQLIGGDLFITTKGSGVAQLQVETRYNTQPSETESCQFELTVDTVEDVKPELQRDQAVVGRPKSAGKKRKPKKRRNGKKRRNRKRKGRKNKRKGKKGKKGRRNNKKKIQHDQPVSNSISFKICARYKKPGGTTGMSIIDVGILTGFSPVKESLDKLRDKAKNISMYEISDRHVVLYVDRIAHDKPSCFTLEMKREFEVGLVQPVPVTAYDYYEPDNKCTTYYGPNDDSQLNLALCDQSKCKCTLDKCTSCDPGDKVNLVVKRFCRSYDLAFKGTVRSVDEKDAWLYIKIDVEDIYKDEGNNLAKGNRIIFKKKASCDCPRINANTIDSNYLIMAKRKSLKFGNTMDMDNLVFAKKWTDDGQQARFFKSFRRKIRKGC